MKCPRWPCLLVASSLTLLLLRAAPAQESRPTRRCTESEARALGQAHLARGEWALALEYYEEAVKSALQGPFVQIESPAWQLLDQDWTELVTRARSAGDRAAEMGLLAFRVEFLPCFAESRDPRLPPKLAEVEERLAQLRAPPIDAASPGTPLVLCVEVSRLRELKRWAELLALVKEHIPADHTQADGGLCSVAYAAALDAVFTERWATYKNNDSTVWNEIRRAQDDALLEMAHLFGRTQAWLVLHHWCRTSDTRPPSAATWWSKLRVTEDRGREFDEAFYTSLPAEYWRRRYLLALACARMVEAIPNLDKDADEASLVRFADQTCAELLARFPGSREASFARWHAVWFFAGRLGSATALRFVRFWERTRPGDDYLDEALYLIAGYPEVSAAGELTYPHRDLFDEILTRYPDRGTTPRVWVAQATPRSGEVSPEGVALLERATRFPIATVDRPSITPLSQGPGLAWRLLAPHYESQSRWDDAIHALRNATDPPSGCGNAAPQWQRERQHAIARCWERLGRIQEAFDTWRTSVLSPDINGEDVQAFDAIADLVVRTGNLDGFTSLCREIVDGQGATADRPARFRELTSRVEQWQQMLDWHRARNIDRLYSEFAAEVLRGGRGTGPDVSSSNATYRTAYGDRAANLLVVLSSLPEAAALIKRHLFEQVDLPSIAAAGATDDPDVTEKLIDIYLDRGVGHSQFVDAACLALRRQEHFALKALGMRLRALGLDSWSSLKMAVNCFPREMKIAAWNEMLTSDDDRIRYHARFLLERAREERFWGLTGSQR